MKIAKHVVADYGNLSSGGMPSVADVNTTLAHGQGTIRCWMRSTAYCMPFFDLSSARSHLFATSTIARPSAAARPAMLHSRVGIS